jgi:hypothetical protein
MYISNLPGLILISDMFFRTLSSEQNKILFYYQEISNCVTQVRTCNPTIPVLEGLPIESKILR